MIILFDKSTEEGNIRLERTGEHTLSLVINNEAFLIEGYPKEMIQASESVFSRSDESLMLDFVMAKIPGHISHTSRESRHTLYLKANPATLERDDLKLLMMNIENHFCV